MNHVLKPTFWKPPLVTKGDFWDAFTRLRTRRDYGVKYVMFGLCDVKKCSEPTFMGWRPLTERRGRQVCEQHWRQHLDDKDSFNLFDEFKFRRPLGILKPLTKKNIPRCSCGRELLPGRRFCTVCAAERERQRKKRAYHKCKNPESEPIVQKNILQCRACGRQREPGHTYCPKCSKDRQKQTNRDRQRRHYRKTVKCSDLT
jgi:hypothetical protein